MKIHKINSYSRNDIIYIDATLADVGRLRFSTKLRATKENLATVLLEGKNLVYEYLGQNKQQHQQKLTFAVIGEAFLDEQPYLKHQTLLKYKSNLKSIVAYFGSKDLRLITQEQVKAYAQANHTASAKINFLNRLITFAKDTHKLNIKPIRFRKHINQAELQRQILPLSLDEIKLILSVCQDHYFKLFLQVAIFTGMRTGELFALTFDDVDFENDKICVCKSQERARKVITSTKTHKSRYIDMLPLAKAALLELERIHKTTAQRSEMIFTFTPENALFKWHTLLESLNLAKRPLYQTRHTFATLMLTHNEEILWISAMLGHKSLSTTLDYYVKYLPQAKKRATFLDDAFQGGI
ncbi:site-specific integrase [Helicobacter sp. MIT 05-5293]|uniref:tyrosine-type recombinase/integrase n=1 Tax=unclassified Helicobacter TaxID=2593540 RepID=UPI000B2EDB7A|nr:MULTISPECIES: site-specific integrase [unclassified Helicobacter]TLD79862.1 site-specific integrase [Helicobacter sp. MIT 05-5293]TLD85535.1 site-specific integrase [Helicobacter sp. MIT 05-5294]